MANFINSFHFATDKLSDRWCKEVAINVVHNSGCKSLLAGKNVSEIEQYATGDIEMKGFIRMFKSYKKRYEKAQNENGTGKDNSVQDILNNFIAIPLIPVKLNSAVHLIFKVPFDIQIKAIDNLADEKREKDIDFLKHRQEIQNIAQDLADQLSQGKVDVGGTKNSSVEYKQVPLDLDLNDPAELKIFTDIIYKLQPEAAYEVIMQLMYELKKINGIDLLEIQDQFKFGVSANEVKANMVTGLPDVNYLFPGNCYAPKSYYPDFRDNSIRYITHYPTPLELQNRFGNEIKSEKLQEIINGSGKDGIGKGYTTSNNLQQIPIGQMGQTMVQLYEIQVISIDGVSYAENASGMKRFVPDQTPNCKTLFGQNTYVFYWLYGTDYFFGKEKLGWGYRQQGQEAFSRFPSSFYRSQRKSAVELCIGENKKAIIADLKLQHAILKAAPNGKYIDLKYIRKATAGLVLDGKSQEEVQADLIDLVMEENVMIGDTEGMDASNEGQFMPTKEIPGGLRADINGYLTIMQQAAANISRWTGINDELSGQNTNPDSLIGARKLNITYGMNSINYAYEARLTQYRNVFEVIGYYIKDAIDKGGVSKSTIEAMIGKERVKSLKDIGSLKDHQFYLGVNLGMRQEERQELAVSINVMEQRGQLKRIERFIIDQTENIKEANLLLATIEHKAEKNAAASAQQNFQNQMQLQQGKVQGMVAVQETANKGRQDLTYTQGDVAAKLMQLGEQLNLTKTQIESIQKSKLQQDRLQAGLMKDSQRHEAKRDELQIQQVAPLV